MRLLEPCLVNRTGDLYFKSSRNDFVHYLAGLLRHRAHHLPDGTPLLSPSQMWAAFQDAQADFEVARIVLSCFDLRHDVVGGGSGA